VNTTEKRSTRYIVRFARQAGVAALFITAALAGTLSGVLFAYADDLPQISALDDYVPNTITRVIGRDGALLGEFATERRVVIGYQDIPLRLRQAVLAAEDAQFFEHVGLSGQRILLTLIKDAMERRLAAGASTLTQQLTRKLFLTDEKTWERKVKEALLAIQIEKRYTKEEIFTFYCNQMYFGHGAYGVEAASQLYFRKSAKDLALEEAALIAGILQGNVRQSPYVNPEAARRRRNYALDQMAEERFVSREEAEAAKKKPIVTRGEPGQETSFAPYFLEEVRKYLEAKYGAKALYENGLVVRTSLDPDLQRAANAAIDNGLRQVARRRGAWRKPARNILTEGHSIEGFKHDRWSRAIAEGDIVPAVVVDVDPRDKRDGAARVRFERFTAELTRPSFQWTRRQHAADLVQVGDLIDVRVTKVGDAGKPPTVTLEQAPMVEGALVAIDNHTGEIVSMVGGFSFARSKFNRATQAYRQMGSTFKPFLYTAAIDRGLTPSTMLVDTPVSFDAGAGQPPYSPHNYDGKYVGPVTLRSALEHSRNVPAVRVMEMLGPRQVVAYSKRFGFPEDFPPYLSTALGAAEATLLEVTSAYSAFPNHGIRLQPFQILSVLDRDGNLLEDHRPVPRDAIRADTAFVLTNLLRGVVQRGTAAAAASLDWPLAGKTGTVDDYTDAWFVGFDPNITVGVWVGYDEKKPIGSGETGAVTALPIWMDFMKAYIARRGDRANPPQFEPPGNIVFLPVNRDTGEPVDDDGGGISEAFIAGTQPNKPPPQ
jgi:penicillin-binding protein 1A